MNDAWIHALYLVFMGKEPWCSCWAPVNDAWIHALYLVFMGKEPWFSYCAQPRQFPKACSCSMKDCEIPWFCNSHCYVWSFHGLPWPQGRPICIKSSVFLWRISTTRRAKKGGCERYKGIFWKKWAQVATS